MTAVGSEQAFLELIDHYFPNEHPHMPVGRGDDCAHISCPGSLCVTTDLFVEDVHFRSSYFSPEEVGHKSLAVNLSDMAAMGAKPLGFSMGLVAPRHVTREFWDPFFRGMASLANRYDLALTGGDLSLGEKIVVSITLWGAPARRVLLRRQARVGDVVFVVGDVGLARAGLQFLEEGGADDTFSHCTRQHRVPEPLVSQGQMLAEIEGVRGLMDISDGLAQDLPRFLGPGLGADLILNRPQVHPEIVRFCARHRLNPMKFCLMGGEDYSLLGAVGPDAFSTLCKRLPEAWELARVTTGGFRLNGEPLVLQGFDHFAPALHH